MTDRPTNEPEASTRRAEVLAWLKSNPSRGYKAAAKALDLPRETVRRWARGTKDPPSPGAAAPAGARETDAARRVGLDDLAWRRDKLIQMEEYISRVLRMDKDASVGLAALIKSAMRLRGEIDHLAAQTPDDLDGATPAEIIEHLGIIMEGWENEHLELAFRVYAERHGGRVLFISDGGYQAEYNADEGWRPAEV